MCGCIVKLCKVQGSLLIDFLVLDNCCFSVGTKCASWRSNFSLQMADVILSLKFGSFKEKVLVIVYCCRFISILD